MITTPALDTYSISELRNHSIHIKNNTRQKTAFYIYLLWLNDMNAKQSICDDDLNVFWIFTPLV